MREKLQKPDAVDENCGIAEDRRAGSKRGEFWDDDDDDDEEKIGHFHV